MALHPDLVLLAAVAHAYGATDTAHDLYALAQYGANITMPMSVGDMQCGLSFMGLDSYRLIAPGLTVPDLLISGLEAGHVTLAQVRGYPLRKTDYWVTLTAISGKDWQAITVGYEWSQIGIGADLGHTLTGFYLVCATPLPLWEKGLE